MKVRCLTREEADRDTVLYIGWYKFLTPNKLYDVLWESNPPGRFYCIEGDNGVKYSITPKLFEPLRNINLDKLLQIKENDE